MTREALESRDSKPIAVLGLDISESQQYRAVQETVAFSDDNDEAPETITKEIAREQLKRLDSEAAKASKKYYIQVPVASEQMNAK